VSSLYLTVAEAAELLRISVGTLHNKISSGVFRERVHFFRPRGSRPLFKRAALEDYIEGRESKASVGLRMAAGYELGSGR
jgi:excisionase family DNA binding protein